MDNNTIECFECKEADKALSSIEISSFIVKISQDWKVVDNYLYLEKKFKNFKGALKFVNKIGELAENIGHHPDIEFGWGYCKIKLLTHKVSGITEVDFYLAKKIDDILLSSK